MPGFVQTPPAAQSAFFAGRKRAQKTQELLTVGRRREGDGVVNLPHQRGPAVSSGLVRLSGCPTMDADWDLKSSRIVVRKVDRFVFFSLDLGVAWCLRPIS